MTRAVLANCLGIAGLSLTTYGLWQWSPPAAQIVLGGWLFLLGLASHWYRDRTAPRPLTTRKP